MFFFAEESLLCQLQCHLLLTTNENCNRQLRFHSVQDIDIYFVNRCVLEFEKYRD